MTKKYVVELSEEDVEELKLIVQDSFEELLEDKDCDKEGLEQYKRIADAVKNSKEVK